MTESVEGQETFGWQIEIRKKNKISKYIQGGPYVSERFSEAV